MEKVFHLLLYTAALVQDSAFWTESAAKNNILLEEKVH